MSDTIHTRCNFCLGENGIHKDDCESPVNPKYLHAKYAALQKAADAMAKRLEYYNRGTTHYEGCEADHPDCAALQQWREAQGDDTVRCDGGGRA